MMAHFDELKEFCRCCSKLSGHVTRLAKMQSIRFLCPVRMLTKLRFCKTAALWWLIRCRRCGGGSMGKKSLSQRALRVPRETRVQLRLTFVTSRGSCLSARRWRWLLRVAITC